VRLLAILALLATAACGHAAKLRPAPHRSLQPEFTFGGPMAIVLKMPLPLPLTSAGASYGLGERFDVSAHAHLTALAFGVAGVDLGSTYLVTEQRGLLPTLSLTGRLYGFTNVRTLSSAAFAQVAGTASYRVTPWLSPYLSVDGLLQLAEVPVIPTLAVGLAAELGRFSVQLEGRWFAPHASAEFRTVRWIAPAGQGAFGPVLSLSYRLGGEEAAR
jgi:hypothetical protein